MFKLYCEMLFPKGNVSIAYIRMVPTQCCGSGVFIPDTGSELTIQIPDSGSKRSWNLGSASASKNLSIFYPKKLFLSSRKYDPECSSRTPNPDFFPLQIPDPGVKKAQKSTGFRIRNIVTTFKFLRLPMSSYIVQYCLAPIYIEPIPPVKKVVFLCPPMAFSYPGELIENIT